MKESRIRARFDWVVEVAGALALALAAGFAGLKLAPWLGFAPPAAMAALAVAGFGVGLLAMRLVRPAPRSHALAGFEIAPIEAGEEPLLLEVPYEEPLLLEERYEEPLLLDDPLTTCAPSARVVKLFADQPLPTAGELKERIDRHLAGAPRDPAPRAMNPPDARGALHAALDELRRSLR